MVTIKREDIIKMLEEVTKSENELIKNTAEELLKEANMLMNQEEEELSVIMLPACENQPVQAETDLSEENEDFLDDFDFFTGVYCV